MGSHRMGAGGGLVWLIGQPACSLVQAGHCSHLSFGGFSATVIGPEEGPCPSLDAGTGPTSAPLDELLPASIVTAAPPGSSRLIAAPLAPSPPAKVAPMCVPVRAGTAPPGFFPCPTGSLREPPTSVTGCVLGSGAAGAGAALLRGPVAERSIAQRPRCPCARGQP